MVQIRCLDAGEWRIWRELRLRALEDSPDAFGETLAHAVARQDSGWIALLSGSGAELLPLIAVLDERPSGMALVRFATALANLYAMWVDPIARRRGAGEALVRTAAERARERGIREVALRVSEARPAARTLYMKCGFVDTGGREPLRPGSEISTHLMTLRLAD